LPVKIRPCDALLAAGRNFWPSFVVSEGPASGAPEYDSLVLEDPIPNAAALFINDGAFLKKDVR
jgi:hypothetical protein